jgi:hypothetical protein
MEKVINILLLSQHFPPENSGGIGRPYSLYKYLPENGINVFVVTVDAYGTLVNESNIYRCDSFFNWRKLPVFSFKRLFKYATLLLSKTIFNYTDWYWYFSAKRKINQIINDNNIQLIYSTFPSTEPIRLGYISSKAHKTPFIVEFRDGLVFESIYGKQNWFREQERKRVERKSIKTSNVVITIGNNLSKYFQKTYPDAVVKTVFNGYDKADFFKINNQTPVNNKEKVKIVIFGSLFLSRKANRDNLFTALEKLFVEKKISNENFELYLIGRYSDEEKESIRSYKANECIYFKDIMPKPDGLAFVKSNFDYVLFYGSPNETTVISSKLLEYLYLGLPIIGICKGNEASDIIEQTGTGEVCDFDVNSIKNILQKALKREIAYNPKQDEIAKFDREYQARQIAQIIKKIVEK